MRQERLNEAKIVTGKQVLQCYSQEPGLGSIRGFCGSPVTSFLSHLDKITERPCLILVSV